MFLGKYRGVVVDVEDPEKRGRVRLNCDEVLGGNISEWALPCFPPNISSVPKIGDLIWVEFEGGVPDKPIWTGMFYTEQQYSEKFLTDDFFETEYKPGYIRIMVDEDMELKSVKDYREKTKDVKIENKDVKKENKDVEYTHKDYKQTGLDITVKGTIINLN